MKKILAIVLAIIMVFALASCSSGVSSATDDCDINITIYGKNQQFHYIVDDNTGVVYLCRSYGYAFGMTAMINPDGTAVTAQQIGLK